MLEKNKLSEQDKRCILVIYNSYNAQKSSCQHILRKKEKGAGCLTDTENESVRIRWLR